MTSYSTYLYDIFQGVVLLRRAGPRLVRGLCELQPLLEPPEVVVELLPVALGAQRTRQAARLTAAGDTTCTSCHTT